ncbi:PAS domain S-box protein [Desulfurispira natronophila]|uniref:PAS domain S-box protein n=1 Tax=Desulfurispira natronophila TaxID=682562 RepID=UPI001612395C
MLLTANAIQAQPREVTLGVLAFRSVEHIEQRFAPLIDFLECEMDDISIQLRALGYGELEDALNRGEIDFVLTNPSHYVLLTQRNQLSSPLATMIPTQDGTPMRGFGGVIVVLADSPIQQLADLRGKKIATVTKRSLGGYQVQAYELSRSGVDPNRHIRLLETEMPHDLTINALLDGDVDAAFARSGILEAMIEEGHLPPFAVRVINEQHDSTFPQVLSTPLYPEWPISALAHVDEQIALQFASALYRLPLGGKIARMAEIHGFTVPADYGPVANVLQTLRLAPFDTTPGVTLADAWKHWKTPILIFGLLMVVVLVVLISLAVVRRRVQQEQKNSHQILERIGEGVYVLDSEGKCTFINDAALSILGLQRSEVFGDDSNALFRNTHYGGEPYSHQDNNNPPDHEHPSKSCLSTGLPRRQVAMSVHKINGNCTWILINAEPVWGKDSEKPMAVVTSFSDITQRKQMEQDLRDREHRLELATSTAKLGIWDLDLESGYLEWNYMMFNLYGIDPNDFNHTVEAWQQILHPEDRQRIETEINCAIAGCDEFKSEFRVIRPDGEIIYIYATAQVMCEEEKACRIIGINMDVTAQKQSEKLLKLSEAKFRDLFDHSPVAVIINRLSDGAFLEGNQALYDMTGYDAKELGSLSYWDITPRRYEHQEIEQLESLRTRGFYGPFEKEYIHKDGSLIPVLLNGRLFNFNAEECIYSVVQDITAIRAAQDALSESEQRFRDVAAAAGEYIWETDAEGNYTFLTKPIESLLGKTLESILGRSPFDFMPKSERQRVEEFFREVASQYKSFRSLEHCSLHADGHIVWQLVSGLPTFDATGNLLGYRGVALDITRQKEAEASLTAYAKHTQAILDNVVDGIITIDELGYILSFNHSAERIFGYKASEVLAEKVNVLMPPPHNINHGNYINNYQQGGKAAAIGTTREVEGRHRDGTVFPIELSVTEIFKDSKAVYIGMVRDITERKRFDNMKNQFVSTVSHELRTPLTSINGSLGLIAGGATGELSPQAQQMVDIAYKNSQRLGHLINDLLDMEKIAAGKMRFDMVLQELMPIVEQALESNESYARQFEVSYELCSRDDDMLVRVDAQRLNQVLSNLLSNAAKFSPAGSQVEVAVLGERDMVRVEIRDQGEGIPEDFQQRLFTKFSQADSSDTRKKSGTGLGLAITKELVERMGGSIGVNSRVGEGSTFYFELPAVHRDDMCDTSSLTPESEGTASRILVVEDDPDVARLLALMLQEDGYHADIAYNGAQAVAMVEQMTYDAITLDLCLPDRNGVSIIRQLRTHSTTARTPIIVVSGNVQEGQLALNGGFNAIDWLQKPIDKPTLLECLHRATGGSGSKLLVLHVEDDEDTRRIISLVGQDVATFHAASTKKQAGQQLQQNNYDVVILDIGLPDGSGWDLLPLIKKQSQAPRIIVLSGQELGPEQAAQVDKALLKTPTSVQELIEILQRTVKG